MDELRMQTDETLLRMYMEGDNGAFDVFPCRLNDLICETILGDFV